MSFVLGSKVAEIWKAGTVIFCNDSKISHFSREIKVVKSQIMQNRCHFANFFHQINSWFFLVKSKLSPQKQWKTYIFTIFFQQINFQKSELKNWSMTWKGKIAIRVPEPNHFDGKIKSSQFRFWSEKCFGFYFERSQQTVQFDEFLMKTSKTRLFVVNV